MLEHAYFCSNSEMRDLYYLLANAQSCMLAVSSSANQTAAYGPSLLYIARGTPSHLQNSCISCILLWSSTADLSWCHRAIRPTQYNFQVWKFTIWIWQHSLHFNVSTLNMGSRMLLCYLQWSQAPDSNKVSIKSQAPIFLLNNELESASGHFLSCTGLTLHNSSSLFSCHQTTAAIQSNNY